MISTYIHLKQSAIKLRKDGNSIRSIEIKLKIPRSTLSGWFKNIKLTNKQMASLNTNYKNALIFARKKAVVWHNKQKEIRMINAQNEALKILNKLNFNDKKLLEIALAMLYLGEGSKKNLTSLGNANPLIIKFFIRSLDILYNIDISKFKCSLHLRSDQDENKIIEFWSKQLNIPAEKFSATKDKRTVKSKTYANYKGVCVIRCGKVALQRKLVFIAEGFCNTIQAMDA